MKLLLDYYPDDEIEKAKDELYNHFPQEFRPNNLRKKLRQGAHKSGMNIKDMVEVFQAMHSSEKFATPLFVTATSNFPSLDISNIDAATMHHDINTLKKDFQQYRMDKEVEISDIKSLKQAIVDLTTMIKEKPTCTIPVAPLSHDNDVSQAANISHMNSFPQASYSSVVKSSTNKTKAKIESNLPASSSRGEHLTDPNDKNFSWHTVEKTKKKKVSFIGKKQSKELKTIKPPAKPAEVFISRLSPDTAEKEISDYAKAQFPLSSHVECTKLKTKYNTYSSFKVVISGIPFKESLSLENWPEGVLVRFYPAPLNAGKISLKISESSANSIKEHSIAQD